MNSILMYLEQNENLPRYPELSYTRIIPKNPRSVANFFMKQKPNNYDRDADKDQLEIRKNITNKYIKKNKAETGYDTLIGKLTA